MQIVCHCHGGNLINQWPKEHSHLIAAASILFPSIKSRQTTQEHATKIKVDAALIEDREQVRLDSTAVIKCWQTAQREGRILSRATEEGPAGHPGAKLGAFISRQSCSSANRQAALIAEARAVAPSRARPAREGSLLTLGGGPLLPPVGGAHARGGGRREGRLRAVVTRARPQRRWTLR